MIQQDKSLRKIFIFVENSDDSNKVKGVSAHMVLMTEAYITISDRSMPAAMTQKQYKRNMILNTRL